MVLTFDRLLYILIGSNAYMLIMLCYCWRYPEGMCKLFYYVVKKGWIIESLAVIENEWFGVRSIVDTENSHLGFVYNTETDYYTRLNIRNSRTVGLTDF